MSADAAENCPLQWPYWKVEKATIPRVVHMAAYDVYKVVHGEQTALIEGWCRGGFHVNELIPFLYARSFPKSEWRDRVTEAECNLGGR